jgi:hypothetical protein
MYQKLIPLFSVLFAIIVVPLAFYGLSSSFLNWARGIDEDITTRALVEYRELPRG